MATITVAMSDEQLRTMFELAHKHHGGNVSEMIRRTLSEKYPPYAQAAKTRKREPRFPVTLERAAKDIDRFEGAAILDIVIKE